MARAAAIQDRREQLLDAAISVFAAQGYNAARVSDIVSAAGVAQGTFYLYFKSKHEVLLALVDRFCGLLANALGDAGDEVGMTPDAFRRNCFARARRVVRVCVEHRPLAALFFKEAIGADPELERRLRDFHATMADQTTAFLVEAMRRGFVRPLDPRPIAFALGGMWERAIIHCVLMATTAPDLDRLTEEIVSLQLDGLCARQSSGG